MINPKYSKKLLKSDIIEPPHIIQNITNLQDKKKIYS